MYRNVFIYSRQYTLLILRWWENHTSLKAQNEQQGKRLLTKGGFSNYFDIFCHYLYPALDTNLEQEKELKIFKYTKLYHPVSPNRIHWFRINLSKQGKALCQMKHDPRVCSAAELGKDGITNMRVVGQKTDTGKILGIVSVLVTNCNLNFPLQLRNLSCVLQQVQPLFSPYLQFLQMYSEVQLGISILGLGEKVSCNSTFCTDTCLGKPVRPFTFQIQCLFMTEQPQQTITMKQYVRHQKKEKLELQQRHYMRNSAFN